MSNPNYMNEQTAIRILGKHHIEAIEGTFQAYEYNSCYSWVIQVEDEDGRVALGWEETFVIWPMMAVLALTGEMLNLVEQNRAPELTVRESFLFGEVQQ